MQSGASAWVWALGTLALLAAVGQPGWAAMTVKVSDDKLHVDVAEGGKPVLRYNYGTIPVPEGVGGRYAVSRSDYIHPLYSPDGEELTKDYAKDHPHHRGIYWAWPEVWYKGKVHDLHALQGVYARPVKLVRTEGGPDVAVIEAESRWMWEDKEPIVAERAIIRAWPETNAGRLIDLEFRFTALVEGVRVARRGQKAYGGLNIRLSARRDQKIATFTAPDGTEPRVCWGDLLGVPPGGKTPVGVATLQHPANPRFPGDWVQYPNLNWLQPTFPAKGEKFLLSTTEPLVLRYRLWIHPGPATKDALAEQWRAYAATPR